ncbi:hypothetical protein Drose_35065 [Dactylosporangium roseum]|uniref:Uncharacterized protein n=1 Tax=Dactylosporangium roseum TaxID=47989 RepID=A0ABY5Z2J0_9ACTN|nr:hypothetical protein [Dactylosporangium roseum]UWZ36221.1 hypothetical protein Drose_35065 [Dactylosporangium roseum]
MSAAHRVLRPFWTCAADGLPWPCAEARRRLSSNDLAVLRQTMAKLMAIAQGELDDTDLATLYRRFVAWTLEPDQRCAICGSRRHAAISGVAPRLIPCNALRAAIAASDLPGRPSAR